MVPHAPITKRVVILFTAMIVALLGNTYIAWQNTSKLAQSGGWVEHTRKVVALLDQMKTCLVASESNQQSYLGNHDKHRLDRYHNWKSISDEAISLTADNPFQQKNIKSIRDILQSQFQLMDHIHEMDIDEVRREIKRLGSMGGEKMIEASILEEERLLDVRRNDNRNNYWISFLTLGLSSILGIVLACGICIFVYRDAVARDRYREAIEHREAEFRFMADSLPQLIWTADPEGRITYRNQRVVDFIGKDADQTRWWFEHVHPDDRDNVTTSYWTSIEQGVSLYIKYRAKGFSSKYCWFLTTAIPHRDESGQVIQWYGSSVDISIIKKAEFDLQEEMRRSRLLVESVKNYGIFSLDPEGVITLWSPGAQEAFGYTAEQVIGVNYAIIFPPGLERESIEHLRTAAIEGKYETGGPRIRQDGVVIEVASTISAMRDEGKVVGFVKVVEDITALKAREKELQAAKDRAETASRAKDQFLSVVSHELRTPLTPVIMTLSHVIGADIPEGAELREMFRMFKSNLELEARLIDDLIDVMRIFRGQLQLRWEVVDIHELLQRVMDVGKSEIMGSQLNIQLDLSAHVVTVNADSSRIQHVFWHLIKNAVKFCHGGNLVIRSWNEGDQLIFEFEDNGIGISEEQMSRIFSAFEQGDNSTARRYGGMGVGLAISKSVIEAHHGTLYAHSEGLGHGSIFRLMLPTIEIPTPRPKLANDIPLRVLFVEDDPMTNSVLCKLMTRQGFVVESVRSVQEAITKVDESINFDVLLSDIGLPDGTGHQVVRYIKKLIDIPAIALTGYGMEEDVQKAMAAGFDCHLTKPVDFPRLVDAVFSVCRDRTCGDLEN